MDMSIFACPAPRLLSFFPQPLTKVLGYSCIFLSFGGLLGCEAKPANALLKSGSAHISPASPEKKNSASDLDVKGAKKEKQTSFTSTQLLKAEGQLGPGAGVILIDLKAPAGMHLTEDAPLRVKASGKDLSFAKEVKTKLRLDELPLRLPVIVTDGALGPAEVELTYYYCEDGNQGSCQPERAHITLELDLSGSGAGGEALVSHSPKI